MRGSQKVLLGLVLAMGVVWPSIAAETESLVMVTHSSNEFDTITKREASKIFLKRLRTWKNDEPAIPVDQVPDSPVKELFCRQVHGRGVVNIEVYWKRMIFSGRDLPPQEVASDAEVLEFVRETPGAIGYVSSSAELGGVKKLELED